MKKYKVGFTQGTFDMFHIGHLNLINNAKKYCDYLIVGVNSDNLVLEYKKKLPIINQEERALIVENIKAVDKCFIAETLDKDIALSQLGFNVIFIGDDWKGNPRWEQTKIKLANKGVDVVFLPYTRGISSTKLGKIIKTILDDTPTAK